MNKKNLLIGSFAVVALAVGALIPIGVYAATQSDSTTTFVQKLATKLGIDQAKVQSAVSDVHSEMKAEREAVRQVEIAKAVSDGKLTQRQAEILKALQEIREDIKPADKPANKQDLKNLSKVERQAKMEEFRKAMDQKLVDALNAKGLKTTIEEIQATHKALKDAGLDFKSPGLRRGLRKF